MMAIETEPSKKLRLLVMATKLNTQLGGIFSLVRMAFHTNTVNFVLVTINTCRRMGSVALWRTWKDLDRGFEKDNHEVEGSC